MMGSVPDDLLARRQFTINANTTNLDGSFHYKDGVVLVAFFLDEGGNIVQPHFTYEVDGQNFDYQPGRCNEWGGYLFSTDYTGRTVGVNPGSRVRLTVNGTCVFEAQLPNDIGQGIWVVFTQKPAQ
jgi:hypothetical protein